MKCKGERILLSEGESLWFLPPPPPPPMHPHVHSGVCEGCNAEGRSRGQRAALVLAFKQSLLGCSADGIFSVESLQRKFCVPRQVHLRWSPSRRAVRKQRVDLGCISTCQALNCEYGASKISVRTHSFSLALPFLTL